jgi:hypothetical protein
MSFQPACFRVKERYQERRYLQRVKPFVIPPPSPEVPGDFPERRRPDLAGAAAFAGLEEQPVAALDPLDYVLHRLGAENPPFGTDVIAQIGYPFFQPALAQVLAEAPVVAPVQDDAVVRDPPGHDPLPVQPAVAVGMLGFEFVGLAHRWSPVNSGDIVS